MNGKTGFTNTAKYCFVGAAEKGNMKILASILGAEDSKTRFNELKLMYDYAFENYHNNVVVSKDDILKSIFQTVTQSKYAH